MGGDVEGGGGDGDVTVGEGPVVGVVGLGFVVLIVAYHPVVGRHGHLYNLWCLGS